MTRVDKFPFPSKPQSVLFLLNQRSLAVSYFCCLPLLFRNGDPKENLRKTNPGVLFWQVCIMYDALPVMMFSLFTVRHSGVIASNHFWQLQFQQAPYNHKIAHTRSASAFSSWWTQTPRSCACSLLSLDFTQSSQMKRVPPPSAALNPVWHAGRATKTCPWTKNPASWGEWPPRGWCVIRCCHIGSSPGTPWSAGGPGLPAVSGWSYKGCGQYSLQWLVGFQR